MPGRTLAGVSESKPQRAVGVRDVAARAGVSRQTVSRVLNEHPDVAPETHARVVAAMDELGYRMNNAARALGTHRTRTIGVLASDALQYGPSRSMAAIEASARGAGYWITAAFADSGDEASVAAAIEHLRAQSVDGLIVFAPHAHTLEALDALRIGIPVVILHAAERSGFSVDQRAGARVAVAVLADAGHERIAHLAGPADWLEAEARAAGFVEELAARGLQPGVVLGGDWSPRSGHEAAAAVIASGATAVFAANDQMALGLIGGLRAAGVAVPERISIVGFDDVPEAAYAWPPLTTVRQDFEELARRAVAQVIAEGGGGPASAAAAARAAGPTGTADPIPPVLILRDSVVPPPR
ncbi:Lactose operon repressor [Microbacterium azadirachtae]|uniref:Lactose operon repressor n=1 Tax=Microbacterium azadirachtae TaxID=582680 RepID=A0A0F0LKZ0_9MICO|nr:Lactose operon repressor [Microbacterium azadirachtae]